MSMTAWIRASEIVDRRMREIDYPCKYGHYYCSTSDGGACLNEETDREYNNQLQLLEKEINQ